MNPKDTSIKIRKRMVQVVMQVVMTGFILFVSAWDLTWFWGWVYMGLSFTSLLINGFVLLKYNPEVVAERAETKEGRKEWDKVLGPVYAILAVPVSMVVAGLNFHFKWTLPPPLIIHIIGILIFLLSGGLFLWSMVANKYFATDVRIQEDRDHTVTSRGPYRYIRHPGYVGLILGLIAVPLLLGTLWALVPSILASVSLIIRTALEDKTLQNELKGYKAYVQRTHYRLFPGIW